MDHIIGEDGIIEIAMIAEMELFSWINN